MADLAHVEELRRDPSFGMLARSLWQETELRGAALMVGAGFSRNATRADPTAARAPMWGDLANAMASQMQEPTGQGDPLSMAEAYNNLFGRPRLDELIRTLVADANLTPDALHARLLRLRWTDVLTTNYDTLLERTADGLYERAYEVVNAPQDIARTRAPRIVKLHGSLPSLDRATITRQDYDRYHDRHAPFVNLARQALLENDLCMLGFSGDDPNFVAWSHWVADNIAEHARSLFLVRIERPDPDQDAALRARGIRPIDLHQFTGTSRDEAARGRAAMDVFIAALEATRPPEATDWGLATNWPPTHDVPARDATAHWSSVRDEDFARNFVRDAAPLWRRERETYPGWLEPPPAVRTRILSDLPSHLLALRNGFDAVDADDRPRVLADLLFRFHLASATIHPADVRWVSEQVDSFPPEALDDVDKEFVGSLLLQAARECGDKISFQRRLDWIEAGGVAECRTQAAYARALKARDELDWRVLEVCIPLVQGRDPIWGLRRAALLAEIGDGDTARREIGDTLRGLRGLAARDRRSIWAKSRLGWATLLAHMIGQFNPDAGSDEDPLPDDEWQRDFDKDGCNPWSVIERLDADILTAEQTRASDSAGPRVGFDPGVVFRRGFSMRSAPGATIDRYAQRLADKVGLPSSIPGVYANLMATRLAKAIDIGAETDADGCSRCLVAVTRAEKPILEARFNRAAVALLPDDVALLAAQRLCRAIEVAVERTETARGLDRHWLEALEIWIELLSRLVVRVSAQVVERALDLALRVVGNPTAAQYGVQEALSNLIDRSVASSNGEGLRAVLRRLHEFPLPEETRSTASADDWPDPFRGLDVSMLAAHGSPLPDDRILVLVDALIGGSPRRGEVAARRLETLARAGLLTPAQRTNIGAQIWSHFRRGRIGVPLHLTFPLLVQLPSGDPDVEAQAVRTALMSSNKLDLARCETIRWSGVAAAALVRSSLATSDLLSLFDQLADWRPPPASNDPFQAYAARLAGTERIANSIAQAMNSTVLALLSPGDLPAAALERLETLVQSPPSVFHLIIGPQAARLHQRVIPDVVARLVQGLSCNDREECGWALFAVRQWLQLVRQGGLGPLPEVLRAEVLGLACSRCQRAMPGALQAIPAMIELGSVGGYDLDRLVMALGFAMEEHGYDTAAPHDESIAVRSLVRAEIMRSCRALTAAGYGNATTARLLEAGLVDPLPEVRTAAIGGRASPAETEAWVD